METQEKQTEDPQSDIKGMPDTYPKVRWFVRAAIVFAMVGTVAVAIGTILPFWLVDDIRHMGVFQFCQKTFKYCFSLHQANDTREYEGVLLWKLLYGLVISGYLTLLVGLGCLFSFLNKDPRKTVLAILASVFLTLAAACFSASMIVHLGWWLNRGYAGTSIGFAWYITGVGVVGLLACVICLLVVVLKNKGSKIEPSTDSNN